MATLRMVFDTSEALDFLTVTRDNRHKFARLFLNYLMAVDTGNRSASMIVSNASVAAFSTLTYTGLPLNNETVVINGVTITAKTSGAIADQFNIGADATATATNMTAAINASVTAGLAGVAVATSVAGVVTVTAAVPGRIGNAITITETLTNCALGNATGGKLNSGADANQVTYSFGR